MAGYIKLWRSTLAHRLIRNPYASQLFLWLILQARWTEGRERGVDLKRGEVLTTMPRIQLELNLTEKKARLAIDILRSLSVIVTERAHDGAGLGRGKETVFRFVNWDKHQIDETESPASGQTLGQAKGGGRAEVSVFSHTGKGDSSPKKDKKENKYTTEFETFFKAYPIHKGKGKAFEMWTRKSPDLQAVLKTIGVLKAVDSKWKAGFAQHPATWLFQEGWLDEPEQASGLNGVDHQVQMDRKRTAL